MTAINSMEWAARSTKDIVCYGMLLCYNKILSHNVQVLKSLSYEYVRMHFHQMTADDEEMEEKEEEQKQMSLKQYVMAIN